MEEEGCICLTNKYSALCFSGATDMIQKEVKQACKCWENRKNINMKFWPGLAVNIDYQTSKNTSLNR